MKHRPFVFVILDGYGWRDEEEGNAVKLAKTPYLHSLWRSAPLTRLEASGRSVGLPAGVIGNSEVGHMNLGAGRVVLQDIVRIDLAIEERELERNEVVVRAIDHAKNGGGRLHLMGLVSDGQVHSSLDHLLALIDIAAASGLSGDRLVLHAFTDGRDTGPQSSAGYLRKVLDRMAERQTGVVSTVTGRYWAMDRDQRWDRLEKAFRAIVHGEGKSAPDPVTGIERSWAEDERGDEFILPTVIRRDGQEPPRLEDGDSVFAFNYRADRMRQLVRALTEKDFPGFPRPKLPDVAIATMMPYDRTFDLPAAFTRRNLTDVLAQVVSDAGLRQLHVAETEKYAHVTYFLNGGREEPFPGEDRILVPSPKVATYDLMPEMSAAGTTQVVLEKLEGDLYDLIVLNYANPDMVGHSGVFGATVKALETVDACLARLLPKVVDRGGLVALTSDHGNAEQMIDPENGGPHTAHTMNPVPFWLLGADLEDRRLEEGRLADVVPTCLDLLDIGKPESMTGDNLARRR